jgi:ribosomal small subunit protein bTHX
MGKGDRSTRRGKIFAGSHGNSRLRASKRKEQRPVAVLSIPPPAADRRGAGRQKAPAE